jgi:prolyl oligopeptidase
MTCSFDRPDHKDWGFGARSQRRWQLPDHHGVAGHENKNRVFYKDLRQKDAKVVGLLEEFDAAYDFIGNDGPVFCSSPRRNAPRVARDRHRHPQAGVPNWKQIVPQSAETLVAVNLINNQLVSII